jgi:hypothetical protein
VPTPVSLPTPASGAADGCLLGGTKYKAVQCGILAMLSPKFHLKSSDIFTGIIMIIEHIIQLLRERVNSSNNGTDFQTKDNLSVSLTEVQEIETKLGCTLPGLLRNMYLEIGNGCFDENFRLLSLQDLFVVHARKDRKYLEAFSNDPIGLGYLVIHDWGCNVYSCIDCSNPLFPVLRYDSVGGVFIPEKQSFEDWVAAWINGESLWDAVMGEEKYKAFVNAITTTQDLNTPFLLVLSEWIDELLLKKK